MRRALGMNLDKGWYVYGGSTISQQLVKNLYLSREKTLARKLEEAVIVWAMERTIDKDRILELYLNCHRVREAHLRHQGGRGGVLQQGAEGPDGAGGRVPDGDQAGRRDNAWTVYKKRSFNEWWVLRMDGSSSGCGSR